MRPLRLSPGDLIQGIGGSNAIVVKKSILAANDLLEIDYVVFILPLGTVEVWHSDLIRKCYDKQETKTKR